MNVTWLFDNCRRFEEEISLLAAGCLPDADLGRVKDHLDSCPGCRERLAALKRISLGLREAAEAGSAVEPGRDFHSRLMRAIRQPSEESHYLPAWLVRTGTSVLNWNRAAWGSLATVWLLILFFNLSAPRASTPAAGSRSVSPDRIVRLLKARQDEFVRLLETREGSPQPAALPSPHTRRRGSPSSFGGGPSAGGWGDDPQIYWS